MGVIRKCLLTTLFIAAPGASASALDPTNHGETLFKRFCSGCHYNGGNSINPNKPLHRIYREANGLKTGPDLIDKIRRGGRGMPQYPPNRIPEEDARAIAEYILTTFN